MPEAPSTAIIMAGGVGAGRVHSDSAPRGRGCGNSSWIRSTLAKPSDGRSRAGRTSNRGLQIDDEWATATNAQTGEQFRDSAVALLGGGTD
jgi:hypothetical protein